MKHTILFLALLLSSCSQLCDSFTDPKIITKSVKNKELLINEQVGFSFCWAAITESIYNYHGLILNQVDLVKKFHNRDNLYYNDYISYELELPISKINDFRKEYLSNSKFKTDYIKMSQIIEEINNDNPVLLLSSNHISLIIGYKINPNNTVEYEIMDSFYKFRNEIYPISYKNEEFIKKPLSVKLNLMESVYMAVRKINNEG